ncbi:MAG: hypothetical protein HC930_15080 [Hydrococcus sp. SU_1_0]|nr:hypothetical protein [Hydrococcus sp. SU_1_0]
MTNNQSDFKQQVAKLHRLTVYGRWLLVLGSWLTLGTYALWQLKHEIALWFDYFTWAAVYYTFHFNLVPTLCLAFCIAITSSVLTWQSRNIIWGLPSSEQRQLVKQVKNIQAKGKRHLLWKWINK